MKGAAAAVAVMLALAAPPQGRAPTHAAKLTTTNVALHKLVYARPGTFWAPGERGTPQAGLQRLTDGVLAGRAPLASRETIVLAPYTADLPELPLGSLPDDVRATIGRGVGQLEVDLGGVYHIEALALEADARGDYRVEASSNGRFWHSLWTAPAAFGQQGFVVRTSGPLVHAVDARYVRVSGANAYGVGRDPETFPGESRRVLFAVTELEVFSGQARPRPDTILPGMDR